MVSLSKLKSVDFYRKIPRDLTEASLSGAGLSILAALFMTFLFGMELSTYLSASTSTTVIVDKSSDGEFLRIDFNISFPALSCEFASVDVRDVLGTKRLNITKTVRKFSIDSNLRRIGAEFHPGTVANAVKHDDEVDEDSAEGSLSLTTHNFNKYIHQFPITVVNFYAPWCSWCQRLKPSWEKAANIIKERYDPEIDGRILVTKVDCTQEGDLCRRHHIQGFPSIRIFRKGSDVRTEHGHEHESYYGDRDTESLVKMLENLVISLHTEPQKPALEDKSTAANKTKRQAPTTGGCRVEGHVRVKKVPGELIISARSDAHSFDASQMNMSHVINHLYFGRSITPKTMHDVNILLPYIGSSHDRLKGRSFINTRDLEGNITIEHYIQVVKTEVISKTGSRLVEEYEYTAHSSVAHSVDIPVAKFHLELSPMQVSITENQKSFSHFITNVCAIIGGVFTVAGILDSILHNTIKVIKKKVELGKNF
ncbi:PREDICTED: protein disulfide-isomerase 5-4-like [Lupinus angustifolius]|uniref:protein disulfide-isomerase 5-4-like n=1 Tax=Lupinus angustifolius TaxID=3871 RepID=UPI00092E6BD6|nr:PREDICTED: protein disulfide-isomerase 5-4-like [Lupinus angustifolius]